MDCDSFYRESEGSVFPCLDMKQRKGKRRQLQGSIFLSLLISQIPLPLEWFGREMETRSLSPFTSIYLPFPLLFHTHTDTHRHTERERITKYAKQIVKHSLDTEFWLNVLDIIFLTLTVLFLWNFVHKIYRALDFCSADHGAQVCNWN